MQKSEIAAIISASDLLKGLTSEECMVFVDAGKLRHAPPGTFLFHQEDSVDACFFMLTGRVRLAQLTPGGKQVIVDIISPERYFGLFVAIAGMTHPVSAETIEDSTVYCWETETVRELMLQFPRVALNSVELIAKRFVRLQGRVQKLATERVEQRVAHTLLDISRFVGKEIENGAMIDLALSHQDLAEMAGTNIYSVSRVLRKWEHDDIVSIGRQRILLRNPDHLRLLVEGG
ncbi:MAG: Crp/Fnr family transcriptional regulator [Chloroflexota bacterium]|nr:Crp/Fnr family transcriptional regulator [Chloroflexota bacterium]